MLDFLKKLGLPKSDPSPNSRSLFTRLKEGLKKTRENFSLGFLEVFSGKKNIDAETLEELENFLLSCDFGLVTTETIIEDLRARLKKNALVDKEALKTALKEELIAILKPCEKPLIIPEATKPFVILFVGINGAGKTTTIGKLSLQIQSLGKKVILAAGDTFRAAAVEQLQVWGERNNIPVISQNKGADSASVIFDALQTASAKKIEVLIADTAGRLHTQSTLMEELKKVIRVMQKLDPEAPHEVLLVLDAGIGQNALLQAKKFHEALNITGIVLTKLDGTAKGGIIFNIAKTLNIPIRFIGIGENIQDLKPFEAEAFVEALLPSSSSSLNSTGSNSNQSNDVG